LLTVPETLNVSEGEGDGNPLELDDKVPVTEEHPEVVTESVPVEDTEELLETVCVPLTLPETVAQVVVVGLEVAVVHMEGDPLSVLE